jgi:flagellar biosynthesis GTPase FlhF
MDWSWYTPAWFKSYRSNYLFDATESQLRSCQVDLYFAVGLQLAGSLLFIAMSAERVNAIIERFATKSGGWGNWLMLGITGYGSVYCSWAMGYCLRNRGKLYSRDKCEELRKDLEHNRIAKQKEEAQRAHEQRQHDKKWEERYRQYAEQRQREEPEKEWRRQEEQRQSEEAERQRQKQREDERRKQQERFENWASVPPTVMEMYYTILGLDRKTATRDDVERAFRKAAIKNHPDKSENDPFAEKRFRGIKEAYEYLIERHAK